jgi:hypothetical protein
MNGWDWNMVRFWMDTAPPRALIRSSARGLTVSAWSKNHRVPFGNSPSAASLSKMPRKPSIVSP